MTKSAAPFLSGMAGTLRTGAREIGSAWKGEGGFIKDLLRRLRAGTPEASALKKTLGLGAAGLGTAVAAPLVLG
jgi:hypothetical protein